MYSTIRSTMPSNCSRGMFDANAGLGSHGARPPSGHRTGELGADLGDRRDGVGVGAVEVGVVDVDVGDDRDRVLEVVEDDQDVGQHQRQVGQAEHVAVRLAERRLDCSDEVVAEQPTAPPVNGAHRASRPAVGGDRLLG